MRISDWSSDVCSSDLLVAEVIRRWLNDNGRWNSPKFLGGESYGTTRSAAVANQLMNETYNDVALNGIILISTVLDFAAGADTPGNELSPITNLPRSEEHTSELQSLMRLSYAVFCLKKKKKLQKKTIHTQRKHNKRPDNNN